MPFYIAAILICIYSFYDFKKGFIFFLGLKYLLVTNITVISIPGVPLLTLNNLLTIWFILLFSFKRKNISCAKMSLPWLTPFILLCATWICCAVFSMSGVIRELSAVLNNVIQEVLFIWVTWEVIETREDFLSVFKILTFLTLVSCLYGFYEYSIQENPLNVYEKTLNKDTAKVVNFSYITETIRGYRVRSVFEHPIGAGVNWAMYVAFVAMAYIQYEDKLIGRIPYILTAFLCIPGIILTKMRSGYFFLMIAIFACFNIKKSKFYVLVIMGIIAIIILWPLIMPNIGAVLSIFTGDRYAGSDASTRFDQFDAAFELLKLSPITGLGEKFGEVISGPLVKRLLGLESIWLKVIVSYGLLGVLAYIFTVFYSVILIPNYFRSKPMMFIALAYWLTYSLTSFPGVHTYMFYMIMIYCAKKSVVYQQLSGPRINEWKIEKGRIYYKKVYFIKKRK